MGHPRPDFASLAGQSGKPDRLIIDGTHLKAHRTAASLLKGAVPHRIGRTKGGLTQSYTRSPMATASR